MLNFQEMITRLTQFWADQGCLIHQGYDLEVGAGTFNPVTFLRCLGPEPYSAVYVEPSRRPQDGRYGDNPNRVQYYHQMQVILKPSPLDIQDLYLKSLEAIGLDLNNHDIRFVHDDWENPTIGAWGLGWEIWIDGMEVTQFTYFQAVGGMAVKPVSGELTYGLERLAIYLQNVDSFFDLKWNDKIRYGQVYKRSEWEWSHYNFTEANTTMWQRHFDDFEEEAEKLITRSLPIPAYDFVMKASHAFNILDARGVISVTERTGYMGRIRNLARQLAESYLKSREEQQFPLLTKLPPLPSPQIPPIPTSYDPKERADFLLEIGSEELPALFVPIGTQNLEKQIRHLLKDHGLFHGEISVYGTPRRLAVIVKDLAGGTQAEKIERKGPALSAAFDEKGQATKAGSGFFRSIGLTPPSLNHVKQSKVEGVEVRGVHLFATIEKKGVSTRALLATELPKLILRVDFPKKMRWSTLDIEYARPIRWIVALYDGEEIPFGLGPLVSGRLSYGHRQLSPEPFELATPGEYVEKLKDHHVMVDIQERKESILEQIGQIEREHDLKVIELRRVLPQVLHLVETPFLTLATFDPTFLEAPKEVIISEMVEHQKYFPATDEKGTLLPKFVICCNNTPNDQIRHGNQKALTPRLADGRYLYEEDLKIPLEKWAEKLQTITFQKDLGSMADKVERISDNVEVIHALLPICDLEKAKRAAELCKADLPTGLIGEFPELQGIGGRIYALKQGEKIEIAQAIDEHWMPRGEQAPLPQSPIGVVLSLADKIDNFLSCFAIGLIPTSSSDPHALRRQAIGMIKMCIEGQHHLDFQTLFSLAYDRFVKKTQLKPAKEEILQPIFAFFTARFRSVLNEAGFGKDEIEAVLSRDLKDIIGSYKLISALHEFRKTSPNLLSDICEFTTRIKKILHNQKAISPVQPDLFVDPSEKELFSKLEKIKKSFTDDYTKNLTLLAELKFPVSALFDSVMILDEDPKIRSNRLGLLHEIWAFTNQLLDFSKIQEN